MAPEGREQRLCNFEQTYGCGTGKLLCKQSSEGTIAVFPTNPTRSGSFRSSGGAACSSPLLRHILSHRSDGAFIRATPSARRPRDQPAICRRYGLKRGEFALRVWFSGHFGLPYLLLSFDHLIAITCGFLEFCPIENSHTATGVLNDCGFL